MAGGFIYLYCFFYYYSYSDMSGMLQVGSLVEQFPLCVTLNTQFSARVVLPLHVVVVAAIADVLLLRLHGHLCVCNFPHAGVYRLHECPEVRDVHLLVH